MISLCFVNSYFLPEEIGVASQGGRKEIVDNKAHVNRLMQQKGVHYRDLPVMQQFHHTFWFGNFNFRVHLPQEEIQSLILNKYVQ